MLMTACCAAREKFQQSHRTPMPSITTSPQTIDTYIAQYSANVQEILQKIRAAIHDTAPDAQETIKYGIPTFVQNGNMLSFAAYKKHVALYPVPAGNEKFQHDIAPYRAAKSTFQLPLDKPIPYALITKFIKYRVKEHLASVKAKAIKK